MWRQYHLWITLIGALFKIFNLPPLKSWNVLWNQTLHDKHPVEQHFYITIWENSKWIWISCDKNDHRIGNEESRASIYSTSKIIVEVKLYNSCHYWKTRQSCISFTTNWFRNLVNFKANIYTFWCHWSFHQKWKNFITISLKNPVNLWVKVWLVKIIKITEEINDFYKENIQWLKSFQSAGVKPMITLGIISKINKFYKKDIQRLSSLQNAHVKLVITLAITSKMNKFY